MNDDLIIKLKEECKKRNYTYVDTYIKIRKNSKRKDIYMKYICNKHIDKGILEIRIDSFENGSECKFCSAKRIASKRNEKHKKEFKGKIYNLVRDEYTLLSEYVTATSKVKIKHNICNKEYEVTPSHFLGGARCPFCMGRYKTTDEFKKEIFELVKDEYSLVSEYINSTTKLIMKHNVCGHEYEVAPNKFLGGNRCPFCQLGSNNKSKLAHKIESFLCKNKIIYKKEYRFENCRNILPLPFDFAIFDNKNLFCLIEADGAQHFEDDTVFGKDNYQKRLLNDSIKNDYCKENKIKLIRIPYWEFNNVDSILSKNLNDNLYNQSDNINLQYNNFNVDKIIEIRKLYSLGQNSMNSIGKLFNINKYYMSSIIKYEIYPDVAIEYKDKINEIKNNTKSWRKNKIFSIDENTRNEIKSLYSTGNYSMR